jgi:hypothetical protein
MSSAGTNVMILKVFSAKNFKSKLKFWTENAVCLFEKWIMTLVKKRQFIRQKNLRK